MVDPISDKQKNFVIDEKFGNDTFGEDTFSDEEEHEFEQENGYENRSGISPRKYLTPYTIGAFGLVTIVILFIVFLSGPENSVDSKQLESIEARIQQLEQRLPPADTQDETRDRLDRQDEKLNSISERFDRFNTTISAQINQIIKELGALQQKSPPASSPQQTKSKPEPAKPAFHEVRPGDTLWGISRQYGLTLDQLRNYNKLGSKAAIKPGQRLKLTPN